MKPSQSDRVRIVNPVPGGSAFTSLRAAREFHRRGRAVFEGPSAIRFIDDGIIVQERQMLVDMRRDSEYWGLVAQQRGASPSDVLAFEIRCAAEKPQMAGGPAGFSHLTFIPAIIPGKA